jgi:hypothetical protein
MAWDGLILGPALSFRLPQRRRPIPGEESYRRWRSMSFVLGCFEGADTLHRSAMPVVIYAKISWSRVLQRCVSTPPQIFTISDAFFR